MALKANLAQYSALLDRLEDKSIDYFIHGDLLAGTEYLRDSDNILVKVKIAS